VDFPNSEDKAKICSFSNIIQSFLGTLTSVSPAHLFQNFMYPLHSLSMQYLFFLVLVSPQSTQVELCNQQDLKFHLIDFHSNYVPQLNHDFEYFQNLRSSFIL